MNKRKGLERLMVRLRPDTIAALKNEAKRRAKERGSEQPSASEVVQEAIDAWLAKLAKLAKR